LKKQEGVRLAKKIVKSAIVFLLALSVTTVAINGQIVKACVDEGVTFEFDGGATLTLYGVAGEVSATGVPTYNYPPLPPIDEIPRDNIQGQLAASALEGMSEDPAWDIRVIGDFEYGTVGLPWTTTPIGEMWQIDLILGDVNFDGTVDCKDVKILTRAYGSSQYSRIRYLRVRYNPNCDLNNDHKVNLRDLCILLKHFGQTAEWQPLENVIFDETNLMIYGDTDHFSIFRCR